MPSPPVLDDIDALLAPIPQDRELNPDGAPAGTRTRQAEKDKLEDARKEDDPTAYADNDPMRPKEFKKADWPLVVKTAKIVLTRQSKDLLIACRLLEGLVKIHGFAGLRDGLLLLRRMVEDCWDRLYPELESDDDIDIRAGPFNWIDDPDRGARFPVSVRLIPMTADAERGYGWQQWRAASDPKHASLKEPMDKAFAAMTREKCQLIVEDLEVATGELMKLLGALNAKMGSQAPGMTGLRQALVDCATLAGQLLNQKGGPITVGGDAEPPPEDSAASDESTPQAPVRVAKSTGLTRDDVYRELARLSDLLQKMEPHSPIPYLIKKACELGALPFPMLMQALIREPTVLSEMNRELGIKEEVSE